jgi:hypothetical protein
MINTLKFISNNLFFRRDVISKIVPEYTKEQKNDYKHTQSKDTKNKNCRAKNESSHYTIDIGVFENVNNHH